MVRYGMVIDLKRCIGCDTCTLACKSANATQRGVLWNRVLKYETGKYPDAKLSFMPVTCMHCEEPACEQVCPSGATLKRADGIVSINSDKCIGCRYCMIACPYTARYYFDRVRSFYPQHETPFEKDYRNKHRPGSVQKCDFCLERVEQGLDPACVAACPTDARVFGDLDDPASRISLLIGSKKGFVLSPEMNTRPSVYYLPGD
ncbi:MAG: 4Fe-4S dicluster domain-containing protein [Dehalococcoidales bacterium]|nr:4Fe-4S dicluster domain-containing protein [Dehalococcoidales bacterium]